MANPSDISDDFLTAGRLLDRVQERLAQEGNPIALDQLLKAHALLSHLRRAGANIDRSRVADLLVPILSTSRQTQRDVQDAFAALTQRRAAAADAGHGMRGRPSWRNHRTSVWQRSLWATALTILTILLLFATVWVLPGTDGPTVASLNPEPLVALQTQIVVRETSYRLLLFAIVPAFLLLTPFIGAVLWLIRTGRRGTATLRRISSEGWRFDTLRIPSPKTAILCEPSSRRALIELRKTAPIEQGRFDVSNTIRATVRRGGSPSLRWRHEAQSIDYVLLCECGSALDHMTLLADAMSRRLIDAGITLTRYDLDAGMGAARHAGGWRIGNRVENLREIRRRHQGQRLIVLGSAEGFCRRFERPGGQKLLWELLQGFQSPLFFSTAPPERWGISEINLRSAGMNILPADDEGVAAAEPQFGADKSIARRYNPSRTFSADPLLAHFHRDSLRLTSNLPPPDEEVSLLVRRLRSFLLDVDGWTLLGAIALFPHMAPAITARLAQHVNNMALDARLTARLSIMPWMRVGRMPDWMRIAILQDLSVPEKRIVCAAAESFLEELYDIAGDRAAPTLHGEVLLEILQHSGRIRRFLTRVGLHRKLHIQENIFVRFLNDLPIGELEIQASEVRSPIERWRLAAATVITAVGCVVAWMAPGLALRIEPRMANVPGWFDASALILVATGYTYVCWSMQSLLLGSLSRNALLRCSVVHMISFVIGFYLIFRMNVGSRKFLFSAVYLFGLILAYFNMVLFIDPRPIPLRLAELTSQVWRKLIVKISPFASAFLLFAVLFPKYSFFIYEIIPITMIYVYVAFRHDHGTRSVIIDSFPRRIIGAICASQNILAIYMLFNMTVVKYGYACCASLGLANVSTSGLITSISMLYIVLYLYVGFRFDKRLIGPGIIFSIGVVFVVAATSLRTFVGTVPSALFAGFGMTLVGCLSSVAVRGGMPGRRSLVERVAR